jgi:hypothetical protein
MYQTVWEQRRPYAGYNLNAHSLYLQAMAELGIPGLVLLALLVGVVLGGLAVRAHGPRRSLYGALLAAGVVWALHAGVDWDWEMPVITVPFFAAAGVALGPSVRGGAGRRAFTASRRAFTAGRLVLAPLCLAAIVLGLLMIGSQSRLTEAERALYASHCTQATSAAASSSNWLGARPEPYEILGFCDLRRGKSVLGVAAMERALRRDPGSWERYYTLAIAQASAGIDPRPAAVRALRMNPREPLTRQAAAALRGSSRRRWIGQARILRPAALASNHLSIAPS